MYRAKMFEIVFSFHFRTTIYFHVYIILDFPITSESACLHKTVNMVVFFVKSHEHNFPKGRALMQMNRVVPITKKGNCYKGR